MDGGCDCHQLSPSPAIWMVAVIVISWVQVLPYGWWLWWSSVGSKSCHMDGGCDCHQLGPSPAIWIVSLVVISLVPILPFGL